MKWYSSSSVQSHNRSSTYLTCHYSSQSFCRKWVESLLSDHIFYPPCMSIRGKRSTDPSLSHRRSQSICPSPAQRVEGGLWDWPNAMPRIYAAVHSLLHGSCAVLQWEIRELTEAGSRSAGQGQEHCQLFSSYGHWKSNVWCILKGWPKLLFFRSRGHPRCAPSWALVERSATKRYCATASL